MSDFLPYLISGFIGIGLAAASGFRVFLPFFFVSLASYLGWIPISDQFEWLSGLLALITTGVATVIEILAYYIPFVDNILDSLAIPLATIAGSVLFASQFIELGSFSQWALALIAGGGTAATIATGFAGTRAASSASTAGIGNNVITTTETAGAGVMSALSLFLPVIAFLIAIVLLIAVIIFGQKIWRKLKVKTS